MSWSYRIPPSGRQGVVEIFFQFVEVERKGWLVTMGVTTDLNIDPFINGLDLDPDAPVREEESATRAKHDKEATEPDHPDTGVFGYL